MKLSTPGSFSMILIIFSSLPCTIPYQSFLFSCYCIGLPFHVNQKELSCLKALCLATAQPSIRKYQRLHITMLRDHHQHSRQEAVTCSPWALQHQAPPLPKSSPAVLYTTAGAIFSPFEPHHYKKAPLFYLGFSTHCIMKYGPKEQC